MVHLLEKHHNDHFKSIMDYYMPKWKEAKAVLAQYPLAHEAWDY
jgi:predicted metal-dependent hydrolase